MLCDERTKMNVYSPLTVSQLTTYYLLLTSPSTNIVNPQPNKSTQGIRQCIADIGGAADENGALEDFYQSAVENADEDGHEAGIFVKIGDGFLLFEAENE